MLRVTVAKLVKLIRNVKLSDLPTAWQAPVNTALKDAEIGLPKFAKVKLKGSQPHKSTDDPSDPENVITAQLLSDTDTRVASIHIHKDGSAKMKKR